MDSAIHASYVALTEWDYSNDVEEVECKACWVDEDPVDADPVDADPVPVEIETFVLVVASCAVVVEALVNVGDLCYVGLRARESRQVVRSVSCSVSFNHWGVGDRDPTVHFKPRQN